METKILDGRALAQKYKDNIKEFFNKENATRPPCLAVVSVGDNDANSSYIRSKQKACDYVGFTMKDWHMRTDVSQEALDAALDYLNYDPRVDGVILQLPIPDNLDAFEALRHISKEKDVDGLTLGNYGELFMNSHNYFYLPATAIGIENLLREYNIPIEGKNVTIVGRSRLVGQPLAKILQDAYNATVTVCHSHTGREEMTYATKHADIFISAIGKAKKWDRTDIKEGAVVIDVGINRDVQGRLCGDCDFDSMYGKASYITPVPGGVGPMTVAMLLTSVWKAWEKNKYAY